jgi:hypothetical protein
MLPTLTWEELIYRIFSLPISFRMYFIITSLGTISAKPYRFTWVSTVFEAVSISDVCSPLCLLTKSISNQSPLQKDEQINKRMTRQLMVMDNNPEINRRMDFLRTVRMRKACYKSEDEELHVQFKKYERHFISQRPNVWLSFLSLGNEIGKQGIMNWPINKMERQMKYLNFALSKLFEAKSAMTGQSFLCLKNEASECKEPFRKRTFRRDSCLNPFRLRIFFGYQHEVSWMYVKGFYDQMRKEDFDYVVKDSWSCELVSNEKWKRTELWSCPYSYTREPKYNISLMHWSTIVPSLSTESLSVGRND